MIPGKVIGRVVPSKTLPCFQGVKLLLVQPVNKAWQADGEPVVVCDAIGANEGEYVFLAQGREATFPLPVAFNPADMTIIAIVDRP
jgi:microcompartment protein CcmK/EutM